MYGSRGNVLHMWQVLFWVRSSYVCDGADGDTDVA